MQTVRRPTSLPYFGSAYASPTDDGFVATYSAQCYCGAVCFEFSADPVDAKICHCKTCQVLHGAPMQWAAIFHKHHVRLVAGVNELRFFHSASQTSERQLPCKVSCRTCGTMIADEGRTMWLAFPTLFDFGVPAKVPPAFRPTCHIFYSARVMDAADALPKWAGHKDQSARL